MQTQLLSKDFQVQSLIDQIYGCLTSIQAQSEIDPTEQQIETLKLLLTVTQRAHKDIIEQPTIAPAEAVLPKATIGVNNLSEYKGRELARKLMHTGNSLREMGDSHSDWAGTIQAQEAPSTFKYKGVDIAIS